MSSKKAFIQKESVVLHKEKEVEKRIDFLLHAIERTYPSLGRLMWRSFLQGLFVALGSTIGLTIFLALVTFVLNQLRFIPLINSLFIFFNQ